jgi:hypothetical protein
MLHTRRARICQFRRKLTEARFVVTSCGLLRVRMTRALSFALRPRFRHIADFDLGALVHRMNGKGVHKLAVEPQREAKDLLKLRRDIEDSQIRRQPRNYDGQIDIKAQEQ